MYQQIEIVLTITCLVSGIIFLILLISRIRNLFKRRYVRHSIFENKVELTYRIAKIVMAVTIFLLAFSLLYYIFFVSTHLKFISVYAKLFFSISFVVWAFTEIFLCFSISEKQLKGSIIRRISFYFGLFACLLILAFLSKEVTKSFLHRSISKDTGQMPGLPDTPCGNCASDYFIAFNSGNASLMQTFVEKYRTESYIEKKTMQNILESYKFMYMVSGEFMPVRFIEISQYEIIIFAHAANRNDYLAKTRFQMDLSEPQKLSVFTITPATSEEALQISTIDPEIIDSTIDTLALILKNTYVYPAYGKIMHDSLISYKSSGRYDDIKDGSVLSLRLTEDLWPLCHDDHLGVTFGKVNETERTITNEPDSTENYGFHSIEMMDNNLGYLRIDEFQSSDEAIQLATEAFAKLSDCDALIIDLRYNFGGSPVLVQFFYSYLFDKPTYVGSRYSRIRNDTTDFWTKTDIPGKPFTTGLPLYILTSSNTFSAAEEFAYFLKDMKRATIVGETTRGGAHPVMYISVNEHFGVRVPFARMISPVSKTDWEGVGVIPDIKVPMDKALETAYQDALNEH